MIDVMVAGIGQTPVGEHWDISLHTLATKAILQAGRDAGGLKPDAMYIGNYLASVVSHQSNLGALLAEHAGLTGIEAYTIEAADASGAAAFRNGYMAVASGYVDTAVVVGVEKYTDLVGPKSDSTLAQATDYDYEAVPGLTPAAQAGMLMQRYLYDYGIEKEVLAGFPILAHANAVHNPNAMYHKPITAEAYRKSPMVCSPLNTLDMAPYADGAAAVVLTRRDLLCGEDCGPTIKISGSSVVIDTLALHDRHDMLAFRAAGISLDRACRKAGILPGEVDFLELSDNFSIYAVLALESGGFANRGEGWKLALDGDLNLNGRMPVCTMGGLKGRGHPIGASGVYQIVEAVQQLRGQAGRNQIPNPKRALVQSLGGPASTAITHVLERID